jgi:hypothetical protein
MKEQKIGLGDLVRSDKDGVQGVVKGGSLDGERLTLDTRDGDGYDEPWPTVDRENCTLIKQEYAQKWQKRWH